MIHYKGKGEHSVNELESIIEEQKELMYQRQISKQKLMEALRKIAIWELPVTGKFWDKEKTRPIAYETEYGSNGVRDYIKSVAQEAIEDYEKESK